MADSAQRGPFLDLARPATFYFPGSKGLRSWWEDLSPLVPSLESWINPNAAALLFRGTGPSILAPHLWLGLGQGREKTSPTRQGASTSEHLALTVSPSAQCR